MICVQVKALKNNYFPFPLRNKVRTVIPVLICPSLTTLHKFTKYGGFVIGKQQIELPFLSKILLNLTTVN